MLPTLGERRSNEICTVCWWEDDGQDDRDAERVLGGPNGKYSLSAARANFRGHGHMYDVGHGIEIVERASNERSALVQYARRVSSGENALDQEALRALINAERAARN